MRRLTWAAALAGIAALTTAVEAGSTTSTFGVSAEVVRRCAVDRGSSTGPEVTCVKGTVLPRIGSGPIPAGIVPAAPPPRVLETTAPDGASVRVSVDF
jgi:hypothetical protein